MVTTFMVFTGTLVLAVLLAQIIFNIFFSKSYLVEYKKTAAEKLFERVAENYSDDPNELYTLTSQADVDNISILIFNESGFIYSSRNIDIPALRKGFFTLSLILSRNFSYTPQATVTPIPKSNTEMISLDGVFTYNNENRYIIIETPVESIETVVGLLSRANVLIFSFAFIIAMICSFIMAKRFSRPVMEIKEVAQNVAAFKFDSRANEAETIIEFGELSVSINSMASKLEMMIADLRDKNERLQFDIDHQRRLDKMRREFVANVSHELKTPLCLLMLYSENLKNNVDSIDKDFYCDTIIEEVGKLDEMAKSLLDLSAIENGLSAMKLHPFDFSEMCCDIISRTSVLFDGISSNVSIQNGLQVEGDSDYLERAVKNYIINAVSHTPIGGNIIISLHENGGTAVFSVFNEGQRIAEEDADQIWESFYKTDKARVRNNENHTGLGLYIVKTIVNAHMGAYGLVNHENGVTFWFSVPLRRLQLTQGDF
jgi:signal transduction histidine kinase